jgi:hypothetical protein
LKLLEDKKGVARVIEAFLASMLLMSCLAMIPAQPNLQDSTGNLASTAQNVLLSLDSNGHLASLVDNRDWTGLKSSIESALPLTVWFNLTVFNENMNVLNDFPICNGGAVSNSIVSVDYVCASQNSTYTIYILQLQLSQVAST